VRAEESAGFHPGQFVQGGVFVEIKGGGQHGGTQLWSDSLPVHEFMHMFG